ncbi:GNAT family N-acetyltransferase [Radiobacillus deserti]|uniref:GNAT family N-acetyltransferase n=1 Tax=Radiobacillus deserti TaxID=2594883 RepID=A0A516KES5_9BACI|nr:GNAT family N-acetyltransferase [Radiobacillus deserti]QDP39901.1 GNAT family N-acetyltransferase [Radiobacillus deserti]
MSFPLKDTNRLKLVQITHNHVDDYFAIMSQPIVTKYYGMDTLNEREQAVKIVESFQTNYDNKHGIRWGLIEKETSQFIGTIGLNNLSIRSKRAEIGYELHPDFWRKGFATEAIHSILNYAFYELGLYRIGAVTFPDNLASNQLLEKLGFRQEGLLRGYIFQDEQSHDANVYSILASEWESTSAL